MDDNPHHFTKCMSCNIQATQLNDFWIKARVPNYVSSISIAPQLLILEVHQKYSVVVLKHK